ncbi:hypothetical protein ACQP2Y_12720 [Actinoplanes sp. CA-051413]|uniref:hypothetical protein n=1 Tax=Actinoplanes sp. CA-051413 TaxID=3239899 RepID=UPI003D97C248
MIDFSDLFGDIALALWREQPYAAVQMTSALLTKLEGQLIVLGSLTDRVFVSLPAVIPTEVDGEDARIAAELQTLTEEALGRKP